MADPPIPEPYDGDEADDSFGARRVDALVKLAQGFLANGPAALHGGDRYQIVLHIGAESLHRDGLNVKRAIEDGPGLFKDTARRIACDASTVTLTEDTDGNPLNLGRKTRQIFPALRRALKTRDCGCRFPGCTERRYVDAHHIHHWVDGGETSLSNLVSLCTFHHHMLHEGGFTVGCSSSSKIVFHRPDGRPIPAAPMPPALDHVGMIERLHLKLNLSIEPDACASKWHGLSMDHSTAIEGLLLQDMAASSSDL